MFAQHPQQGHQPPTNEGPTTSSTDYNQKYSITVKNLLGNTVQVEISADTTVLQVKGLIQSHFNSVPSQMVRNPPQI